ncbi:unnamed protein product [Malus baccata var. baccata]
MSQLNHKHSGAHFLLKPTHTNISPPPKLTSSFSALATSSSSSYPTPKPKSSNPNCTLLCKHSPLATLDLLILILVLFSLTCLITSYFSFIFNSISLLFSHTTFHFHHIHVLYVVSFVAFFATTLFVVKFYCVNEGNPDYECLRTELRWMAQTNGRAVLLFRARCRCSVAKLEGLGVG